MLFSRDLIKSCFLPFCGLIALLMLMASCSNDSENGNPTGPNGVLGQPTGIFRCSQDVPIGQTLEVCGAESFTREITGIRIIKSGGVVWMDIGGVRLLSTTISPFTWNANGGAGIIVNPMETITVQASTNANGVEVLVTGFEY